MTVGQSLSSALQRVRQAVRRDGADASGLASLLELSVVNAAGDALITVSLAGSLFFSVSPTEARSKVALYLLITMAPFAVLAPVIGPTLDRFPHGRRLALGAVCLGRAMLAWMLASSLDSAVGVYPLALGLLVMSKAFGVARSAVVPRVQPRDMTLVKVNSRLSLVNVIAGSLFAPLGLAIAKLPYVGYPWVLRLCSVVFLVAAVLVFRLPQHVDSAEGERRVRDLPAVAVAALPGASRGTMRMRLARALGSLPVAVRTAAVLRGLVGFLTFYLAFLLRTTGGTNAWLAGLAIAAGLGSGLGVFIGGRLGRRRPEALLMMSLLGAAAGCVGAALNYSKPTSLLAALLACMAGSVGKLGLDAVIQRDIPDDTRTSAFARSETALQLAWVGGGALGLIQMPGTLGFSLASAVLMAMLFIEVTTLRRTRVSRLAARAAARGGEPTVPGGYVPAPAGAGVATGAGGGGSFRESATLVDPDATTAHLGRTPRVDPRAPTDPMGRGPADGPTTPVVAGSRWWRRGSRG